MDGTTKTGGGAVTPIPGRLAAVGTGLFQRRHRGHPVAKHRWAGFDLGDGRQHKDRRGRRRRQSRAYLDGRSDRAISTAMGTPTSCGKTPVGRLRSGKWTATRRPAGAPPAPIPGQPGRRSDRGISISDGDADILWQNTSTGQVSIWEMQGNTKIGGGAVSVNPGTAWQAIGTGDFTNDGFSDDILFQNTNTGQVSVWEMDGIDQDRRRRGRQSRDELARDRDRRGRFRRSATKHQRPNLDLGGGREHQGRRRAGQPQCRADLAGGRADLTPQASPSSIQRLECAPCVGVEHCGDGDRRSFRRPNGAEIWRRRFEALAHSIPAMVDSTAAQAPRSAAGGQGVEAQRLAARAARAARAGAPRKSTPSSTSADALSSSRRPRPARRRSLCLVLVNAIPSGLRLAGGPTTRRRAASISCRPANPPVISNDPTPQALYPSDEHDYGTHRLQQFFWVEALFINSINTLLIIGTSGKPHLFFGAKLNGVLTH